MVQARRRLRAVPGRPRSHRRGGAARCLPSEARDADRPAADRQADRTVSRAAAADRRSACADALVGGLRAGRKRRLLGHALRQGSRLPGPARSAGASLRGGTTGRRDRLRAAGERDTRGEARVPHRSAGGSGIGPSAWLRRERSVSLGGDDGIPRARVRAGVPGHTVARPRRAGKRSSRCRVPSTGSAGSGAAGRDRAHGAG